MSVANIIFDDLFKKLDQVELYTAFIKAPDDVKLEMVEIIQKEARKLKQEVDELRGLLNRMKIQNNQCKETIEKLKLLEKSIGHMENNIPPMIFEYTDITDNDNDNDIVDTEIIDVLSISDLPELSASVSTLSIQNKSTSRIYNDFTESQVDIKDCRKVLFKDAEDSYLIDLITPEEFQKIPKYLINRYTLENINGFINNVNKVLKAKYDLLALGKNGVRKRSQKDLELFLHFKSEEKQVSNGKDKIYFFNAEDYLRQMKVVLDRTKLNYLNIIRHCKRIREIRIEKKIMYVVIM